MERNASSSRRALQKDISSMPEQAITPMMSQIPAPTAFVVEQGAPGFSLEKINEIMFESIQNGVLDFDDVTRLQNRIGEEGDGWKIMTAGLNFETDCCAMTLGWQGELLRNAVAYARRKVRFPGSLRSISRQPDKDRGPHNQTQVARVAAFYSVPVGLGWDITLESNASKVFCAEGAMQSSLETIQVMGGDGVTPFYPLQAIMGVGRSRNRRRHHGSMQTGNFRERSQT